MILQMIVLQVADLAYLMLAWYLPFGSTFRDPSDPDKMMPGVGGLDSPL